MRHWKCRLYSFPALVTEDRFWQIFSTALRALEGLRFLFYGVAALHAKVCLGRKILAAL